MTPILGLIAFVVWIYILRVIHKSQLPAWEFVWGSCGIFVFMILFIRPYCTQPLAQTVAADCWLLRENNGYVHFVF